jgi:predicted metal-dependent HD superfamily phosphohydrolase
MSEEENQLLEVLRRRANLEGIDDTYPQVFLKEVRKFYEGRAYHNIKHITYCLSNMNMMLSTTRDIKDELVLAIWLHDTYIDPANPQQAILNSVSLAKDLFGKRFKRFFALSVFDAIHETEISEPNSLVGKLLHDLDYMMIGEDADEYNEYASAIEKEVIGMGFTIEQFLQGRYKFLKDVLSRPRIYNTGTFARFEWTARTNIIGEMGRIRARAKEMNLYLDLDKPAVNVKVNSD